MWIYVHSGLAVIEKLEPLIEGSEAISLLVAGLDEVPLRITAIYRQPSSDTGRFTDDLHNFLHSISHADHNHIITGDINIDILKQESDSYTDLLHQYSYTHLIEHPTRTTQTSSSCIDHIAINFYSSNVISGTLDKDISDHFPVFAFFENLVQPKSQTFKRRTESEPHEIFSGDIIQFGVDMKNSKRGQCTIQLVQKHPVAQLSL
ncbi:hypothetical protein EB796_013874 [Bugula neritina]|uniref:Endonuclease/exonuclease/phosphatase domain-containing protein n=1 Tax=Bugula neritina TaxID=10212 RepID=A0A7J7JQV1_BUGNE|nr:hypothetical protein EB796_013874 [Bugula neritina]